jgi:hydroxyethylthiazole kinase-like uncharacterized protein yjeF
MVNYIDCYGLYVLLNKLPDNAHKYSHGTVAVVAGSAQYPGAAVLTIGGARRGGSGYIRYISQDNFCKSLVITTFPDVVCEDNVSSVEVDAWVIGPGNPQPIYNSISSPITYLVLDAGAIREIKEYSAKFIVVTPHVGEARKIGFESGVSEIERKKLALKMAEELQCVVLLKGHKSVVVSPSGAYFVDDIAGPELATAGTGDILSGLIGSMLAAWKPGNVNEVAEVVFKAVTAHALAGREVAKLIAPVTATDILERLPYLLRDYQENTID